MVSSMNFQPLLFVVLATIIVQHVSCLQSADGVRMNDKLENTKHKGEIRHLRKNTNYSTISTSTDPTSVSTIDDTVIVKFSVAFDNFYKTAEEIFVDENVSNGIMKSTMRVICDNTDFVVVQDSDTEQHNICDDYLQEKSQSNHEQSESIESNVETGAESKTRLLLNFNEGINTVEEIMVISEDVKRWLRIGIEFKAIYIGEEGDRPLDIIHKRVQRLISQRIVSGEFISILKNEGVQVNEISIIGREQFKNGQGKKNPGHDDAFMQFSKMLKIFGIVLLELSIAVVAILYLLGRSNLKDRKAMDKNRTKDTESKAGKTAITGLSSEEGVSKMLKSSALRYLTTSETDDSLPSEDSWI